jgi:hypothetical protein
VPAGASPAPGDDFRGFKGGSLADRQLLLRNEPSIRGVLDRNWGTHVVLVGRSCLCSPAKPFRETDVPLGGSLGVSERLS